MEHQPFDVELNITFYRRIMAKNSDYALQKAKHVIGTLTPAQLLETATGTTVIATKAVPLAPETRRLHGVRDTGWPHTASAAEKARAEQENAQHSLRDRDWR